MNKRTFYTNLGKNKKDKRLLHLWLKVVFNQIQPKTHNLIHKSFVPPYFIFPKKQKTRILITLLNHEITATQMLKL